jgi:hypothetical protein
MKLRLLFGLVLLTSISSCSAGMSSLCGYDASWHHTEICEDRFHHKMKPSVAVVYAYNEKGEIVELVPLETTSTWTTILSAVAGAAP